MNKLLSLNAPIFLGNAKFDRSHWTFFIEAARFFVRWLAGWRSRYLFDYRIARVKEAAFLVGSAVHERELAARIPGPIDWFTSRDFGSLKGIVWPKIKVIGYIPLALKVLAKRRALPEIFHLLYNLYNYEVSLCYLEMIGHRLRPKAIGTFELGFVGAAVLEYTSRNSLRSVFVQHGLFDQANLPIKFDEYYIWTEWDHKFFSGVDEGGRFHLKFPRLKPPHVSAIGKSKVLYFALEYPGPMLTKSFILKQVGNILDVAKDCNWKVVLRPHPNDTSDLAELLATRGGNGVSMDAYSQLPVAESFRRNDGALFVTFNSASVMEMSDVGHFCVTIKNPLDKYILMPLSQLSLQLESSEQIESLLDGVTPNGPLNLNLH